MNKTNIALFGGALISDTPIKGKVTVANESQASAGNLSQALTSYVVGVPSNDEEAMLDRLFPSVPTGRVVDFRTEDDEHFITETNDEDVRAPGAAFKSLEYNGGQATERLQNKGLTIRVDHDTLPRDGSGNLIAGWENSYAVRLKNRLIRAELLRGFALLDTAATNSAKVWDGVSNPDADMRHMLVAGQADKGLKANTVAIGDPAWQIRQDAYEDADRDNLNKHAEYMESQIAAYLGVSNVARVDSLYSTKKSGNKTQMYGHVISYFVEQGLTTDDPSSVKRFVTNTDAGGRWGVYVRPSDKFTDITVEHYSRLAVTSPKGIRKLTISES